MPESKVRKKRTTKAQITKTKRDKLIEKYCSWVNDKDFSMNFRNNFPTDIDEINKYLIALEEALEKYATSFEVEADKKLFQSYRYGYAVGFSEGVSQVLDKIKEVRSNTIAEEDEIANQISTNKVFDYLSAGIPIIHDLGDDSEIAEFVYTHACGRKFSEIRQ